MTDLNRHHIRAAEEYFLRCIALVSSIFPKDLVRGVIWVAINSANVRHLLDDADLTARFAEADFTDAERRPVSRAAIAHLLGLPPETCRRQINHLIRDGMCLEVGGGRDRAGRRDRQAGGGAGHRREHGQYPPLAEAVEPNLGTLSRSFITD